MTYIKDSFIVARLKQKLRSFILKENYLPPLLYFLMFIYFHYPFETQPSGFGFLMFSFALLVAIVCHFNFIFTMAAFLHVSTIAAVPMLAVTLLFCNEKWKLYLFIFAVGDSAFSQNSQQYFLAIFSFLICFQIYRTFVFRTVAQNVQYFVGMAAISTYYSLSIFSANLNISLGVEMYLVLVIAVASLAHSFIQSQVDQLRQADPNRIYSSRVMAHYLRIIEREATNRILLHTRLLFHNRSCLQNHCFCHSNEHKQKNEYFMRQLYENALERFRKATDCLLFENYVDFLLRNEQAINALHFLSQWQPKDFFSFIGRERARARVERLLREENSSNLYELQYEYALEYDQHYQRVAVEINTVLKLKLQFWGEVSRETPKVARMQKLGMEIIDRMHGLNVFYNKVIKGYEKSLFLFDTTALYAMYMLSTTNFKEYAELIIKNTAKLLQEVYVFESSASETFAIRTVVRREETSFINHPLDNLKPLRNIASSHTFIETHDSTCCKLVIDAVSSGLCKILGTKRNELIGRELNTIIPDGYKQVHNVRLSYLLDFESKSLNEIVPSKVMHKQLKLPIKCAKNQLAMGYVCIKFIVDLIEGLTFVSVVKLSRDRSSHVLMDFQGRVTESEDGFNKEILGHSEIKRYLQRLRDDWEEEKVIREERFNLMINTANYGVTISSPLLGLFLEKENLKEKCPPIHLEITNQQTNRNHTVETDRHNNVGLQIKRMEKAINTFDAESSTNNSRSGSSAVNVINTFSEASSTPIYRFLQLVFLATILSCVLSNLGAFFVTELPWDVTIPTKNPLNDTMNLYALQMLTNKALLTLTDEQNYLKLGNSLNRTRISQYFGYSNYQASMVNFTAQMETAFKDSLQNCLGSPSALLQPYITERLKMSFSVSNPTKFKDIMNTSYSQNLTYLELLMIYASDLNLMTHLQLNSTVLAYSFTVPVSKAQDCSFLSPIIDSAVNHNEFVSVAVQIALIFLIALLLIPSYFLLKKRLSLHEKVFDLLVSIDAEQVALQMRSLQYICNILRNSKESNEIMKMNVLGYEENLIHPQRSRRSSDNEMILGLEKYDTSNQNYEITVNKPATFDHTNSQIQSTISKVSKSSKKGHSHQSNDNLQNESVKQASVLGMIKHSYLSTQQERSENRRKRSGELDLTGSMLDPSNKLLADHCILYFVSLSFLLILGLSIHFKLQFDANYLQGKNELLTTYEDQILFQQELIASKVLFTYGSKFLAQFFGVPNALAMLVPMISQFPTYNYQDGLDIYSQIITNCTEATPITAGFLAKYCQYDYSEVILRGEFGSLFKQLIELRYMVDNGIGNLNSTIVLQNITEKLYYLESLNLRLEELVLKKVDLLFDSLTDLGQQYANSKMLMLVSSVLWGVVCFVCGFGVIILMKRSYFKEVFMITFLNNEMILKNKRVQSFLELIAKNTST